MKTGLRQKCVSLAAAFAVAGGLAACADDMKNEFISADHSVARLSVLEKITGAELSSAKSRLVIAYGHTSHGSQIVDGLAGLDAFMTGRGHPAGTYAGLNLRDNPFSGASDLGAPDRVAWAAATRTYLDAHPEVNVIVWSWCGQVSDATEADIDTYLSLMSGLERDYSKVRFIYMTGHLDGTGLDGNLHLRSNGLVDRLIKAGQDIVGAGAGYHEAPRMHALPQVVPTLGRDLDLALEVGNGLLERQALIHLIRHRPPPRCPGATRP